MSTPIPSSFATPAAPLSGVEEVDAIILSYLPVEALQTLTLNQQKSPTPANHLFADESRVWAPLLARVLDIDITYGRGIPYRTLYLAATMKYENVSVNVEKDFNSEDHLDGWLVIMDHAVESVKEALERDGGNIRSPGRETLGLLIAVLDRIITQHTCFVKVELIRDIASVIFTQAMNVMARVGCVDGWEAVTARCLGLPLPPTFPMTHYNYNHCSIVKLIDQAMDKIEPNYILMNLYAMMKCLHVTAGDLQHLTTTYLWYAIAVEASTKSRFQDGVHEATMETLQCNYVALAPTEAHQNHSQPLQPPMLNLSMWERWTGWASAASSPDKLRFYLAYLLPLSNLDIIDPEKLLYTLLICRNRNVDDYATLELIYGMVDGFKVPECVICTQVDRRVLLTVGTSVEYILIKAFVSRIRTRGQADGFMVFVSNLVASLVDEEDPDPWQLTSVPFPYGRLLAQSSWIRCVDVTPDVTIDRHSFIYPYLMAVYDAFCGRLDPGRLGVLALIEDTSDDNDIVPSERDSMIMYIAEALVLGKTIREPNDSDPGYVALRGLLGTVQEKDRLPIGARTHVFACTADEQSDDYSMHGTEYGIIAASMYDETLFSALMEWLAPEEANNDTRIDLLVRACAIRYAEATIGNVDTFIVPQIGTGSLSTVMQSNPQEGQLEAIIHRQCMAKLEEHYHNIVPTLEQWEVWRERDRAALSGSQSPSSPAAQYKFLEYPGYALWKYACQSTDIRLAPLVASALLPMAEYRPDTKCKGPYGHGNVFWMDCMVALRLPRAVDYSWLSGLANRLPTDAAIATGGYNADVVTRERHSVWFSNLLPLVWDVDRYRALTWALEPSNGIPTEEIDKRPHELSSSSGQ